MDRKSMLKNIGNLVVTSLICITIYFGNSYSQGSTITLDVNGAKTAMPNGIFGTLMERLGRQWGNTGVFAGTSSTIPNTNGMRNDVIDAFKECGVGAIQWPGGCAAWDYPWKPADPSGDIGTDRFLQFCKLTGAEPVITGPAYSYSAASNLAWLKHIDSTTARLSMDSLRWFKIGNEVWGGCGSNKSFTVSSYCTT